jgi:shikimate kinase
VVHDNAKRGGQKHLALVGFMAAGKSTIGRLLAERLGMPFVDTDAELEKAHRLSVGEIFSQRGEPEFRKAERELILGLLTGEPQVLSVGGGAYVDEQVRAALDRQATVIWLDPPFELILERLGRSGSRPLASGRSAEELRRLWDARCGVYVGAHIRVRTSDAEPLSFVETILHQLG